MSSIRKQFIKQVEARLGRRKLVWFGTRGTDSQALLQISQFSEVFSLIAPLDSLSIREEVCLETLKCVRVDLDRYSIDYDDSAEARHLLQRLCDSLGEPTVIAMYRPGAFFTSTYYPRSEFVEYLGLFHEQQAPFEHKPWVESELRRRGVRTVGWRYFGDADRKRVHEDLENGPVVLRTSRSDGGAGLTLIHDPSEIGSRWPTHSDRFLAVAPYLVPNIPLNVNACVFSDSSVSLHSPSFQLIGLPGFTSRTFGYCGNDFAQVRELEGNVLNQLEHIVLESGKWLASKGYVGAFGVDALLYEGQVHLTEINPRFQGSSHISSTIDAQLDRPDMFLEHIAAYLGVPAPPFVGLRDLTRNQPKIAQVVCHNVGPNPVCLGVEHPSETSDVSCTLLPKEHIAVEPEAILFRAVVENSVTADGGSLREEYGVKLRDLIHSLFCEA